MKHEVGEIKEINGLHFKIEVNTDYDMQAPWDEEDGHGEVSGWASRSKRPGERILNTKGNKKIFYDFQGAILIALKDCWGISDAQHFALVQELGREPTKREVAVVAATSDFEYLRRWCNGRWRWEHVYVQLREDDSFSDYLGGLCSDDVEYIDSVISEMIEELTKQYREAEAARIAAEKAAKQIKVDAAKTVWEALHRGDFILGPTKEEIAAYNMLVEAAGLTLGELRS